MKPLWLSFSLWLIFISFSTQAQNSPSGGRGAVIVGISHYKELDSLQYAHRDAAAFAEFLKTQNVPDDNIKLFLNEDATRFNIVDELYNITQKLNKGDKFFFYFTGHGDLEAKIGYENSLLLLHGCYKKNYFQGTEYLQLSELRTWFGELTKKGVEVVFIADACHSGGLIGGKEGLDKTQRALQESWQGITKILSSQANEFSLEGKQWGGGRGIFSYFLVNGLTGRADANKDKKVSLKELDNYLQTNVVREANPNTQTPVIQGNTKQILSQSSEAGLKRLADAERLSFPIITEANLKAADPMTMIGGLDKTLVETYNKLTKAIAEKRLNTFDNEKDYALLYYRKLAKEKVPEYLLAIMKRNLGASLLERELALLKSAREQGRGFVVRIEKQLNPAIANLDEAMKLFGEQHPLYKFLLARKLVLESKTNFPNLAGLSNKSSVDEHIQTIETENLKYFFKERQLLMQSLLLEPNMISTYALLSSNYRDAKNALHPSKYEQRNLMQDSSTYYQEKVVELLPNQAEAHYNLAKTFPDEIYTQKEGNLYKPHPKAIMHLEQAVALDSTFVPALSTLAEMCQDSSVKKYDTAIRCHERILRIDEAKERNLLKGSLEQYLQAIRSNKLPNFSRTTATSICNDYIRLYTLYQFKGEEAKAQHYWQKLTEKSDVINMAGLYGNHTVELTFQYGSRILKNLNEALYFAEKALKAAENELANATEANNPFENLKYQDRLKILGSLHRSAGNFDKAETYLKQALAHIVPPGPFTGNLKFMGGMSYQKRTPTYKEITVPLSLRAAGKDAYHYGVEANHQMFLLKFEQGKIDEAFEWLDKSFQFALSENGNDISGEPFEIYFIKYLPELKDRFLALKAKYFPPAEKK